MIWRCTLFFLACVLPGVALAASNTFTTAVGVTGDDFPPTTPANFTASLSGDEVSASWDAATDDYAVAGYVLVRDGVTVATTSDLNATDDALADGTTYLYTVRAYDFNLRYSPDSDVATITTPAVTSGGGGGGGGGGGSSSRVEIDEVEVEQIGTEMIVRWETSRSVVSQIEWGTDASYETGIIETEVTTRDHEVFLTDLVVGQRYEFRISAERRGQTETFTGSFTVGTGETSNHRTAVVLPDVTVTEIGTALVTLGDIPETIVEFRIIATEGRFPTDPQDGNVVYVGRDTIITVEETSRTTFYTLVPYDETGVAQSMIALIVPASFLLETNEDDPEPIVRFLQGGKSIEALDGSISLDAATTTHIVVEAIAEETVSVVANLTTGTSSQFIILHALGGSTDRYFETRLPALDPDSYELEFVGVDADGEVTESALYTAAASLVGAVAGLDAATEQQSLREKLIQLILLFISRLMF